MERLNRARRRCDYAKDRGLTINGGHSNRRDLAIEWEVDNYGRQKNVCLSSR